MAKAILRTESLPIDQHSLFISYLEPQESSPKKLTAVILHGAGQADSSRHAGLANVFADHGVPVISLDFVGHGKTGGDITASSLALRTEHALAVINHWADSDTPLILCGFSMSGHTVLRLSKQLAKRVHSIGLFVPATYAAEAESVNFGPEFTEILHTPESWRSSLALQDARAFKQHALIVAGSHDEVIPWEVTTEIAYTLKSQAKQVDVRLLGGVEHKLAVWLSEHPVFCEEVVGYLIQSDSDEPSGQQIEETIAR